MNKDMFYRYKGKYLSIGVANYNRPSALFNYYGIVEEIHDDGVLLKNYNKNKEYFITYERILEYHASGSARGIEQ